jgi:RHH-type proline utilization regulon transcriptional repressor/proline dehydrogenase/delta 1-pyrroline-5-carboxylate dehydrogenase
MTNPAVLRLSSPYRPEAEAAAAALRGIDGAVDWPAVAAMATPWLEAARREPAPFWAVETLLREYPISSAEGNALMRLAEALLRVPDRETAIALTADQLGRAAFDAHSDHWLATLSARALALSKAMLPGSDEPAGLMGRLGGEAVVAIALRAVQLLGRQFVLGERIDAAMVRADEWRAHYPAARFSYDMLGEGARTDEDAQRYLEHYLEAVQALAGRGDSTQQPEKRDGISIKLSALFPRYEDLQRARVLRELLPRAWSLCELAARAGINLTIDAEESERLELSLDVFEALAQRAAAEHRQWRGFGLAIQAYQTRALDTVGHVIDIARHSGLRLMVRLVKGAYWDSEIKRAQVLGLPAYPVFTHKHHTDLSYLACARALLRAPVSVFPQFASHNAGTIAAIMLLARDAAVPFELQRLHGMGESVYREVLGAIAVPCRVYAPVGQYRDLLAYLVRRLLENGANSSFVHQLADATVPLSELLSSPLRVAAQPSLPLPPEIYGAARRNSTGIDVMLRSDRALLLDAYQSAVLMRVVDCTTDEIPEVMRTLAAGFSAWSERTVGERSGILRGAADSLESRMPEFCALLVKEGRKTWDDAIAEVREAIDFLRYYAVDAERVMAPLTLPGPTGESNELRLRGRGAWVCISPWNFPLSIFTGQVAAALVTGNTVAAKPAEQTTAIAAAMVDLLHAAGVPRDALVLCAGAGKIVGAALVADPHVAGIAFTGSTAVARAIAHALAEERTRPLVPFIAETGGVNAMIVDSSALPEQVADAVVTSAFRSAGQRCSALRLLCVHASTADAILAMLRGAVAELVLGDPADPATDVGPVIDSAARQQLDAQIAALEKRARLLARASVPAMLTGSYIAPCIYEIDAVEAANEEIFGPVLQVVRWTGDVEGVVGRINALGFGLTLGVHTRVDGRAQRVAAHARAGNVYVNRSMTGAVVGVQPFGGEGLSGTGPKAGGPHYLARFCAEQTVTINTAAAGGNVELLAAQR